jgi:hypothetical protein
MATPNRPVVGKLYDMEQQHDMHGGQLQWCAPTKDGYFTLLRLNPDRNPDAPRIVDWESSNDPKVRQIQEQTRQKPLPIYVKRRTTEWEYMGRFRVTRVATDARTLAKRKRVVGRTISYAIYLERS